MKPLLHTLLLAGLIQAGGCAQPSYRQSSAIGVESKQASHQRAEYVKVDFPTLANFAFDPDHSTLSDIPPAVRQLDGQRVKITGNMASVEADIDAPTDKFMLLPRDFYYEHPRLPQFMLIRATDTSGKFRVASGLVEIGGVFHVALLKYDGEIYALYSMDADYCTKVEH